MDTATHFYSAVTGGFYRDDLHADIPADAVPISVETYTSLMQGHVDGMQILPDANGAPTLVPPPSPPLDELKASKAAAIRQYRDALTESHITIDGNHYHSDPKSRIQQMGLAKLAASDAIPPGLQWMTKNNGPITMTNAIALQFEPVTLAHDVALFTAAQAHIEAVEALDTVQAVQDYDFSSGWPTI